MRLWNDYEGTTIAEAYPIEKLIRPEGRSAFFSTSNGTGTPAVIRLIESINDESEILSRWKTVAELKETHLITLKKFGQTVFEGTPLIYVLMESTEADLSGILSQRTLTVEETRQIAISLVEAVAALHAAGIVHEHIEPANVMATGEVVKLRSDCIREAPEGAEGEALKRQDVHDLAVVLLQALTFRKSLDGMEGKRLPAPFEEIIRNGISGGWGLTQIAAALQPPVVKEPRAPIARVPAAAAGEARAAVTQQIPLVIPRATEQTTWSGHRAEPAKSAVPGTVSLAAAGQAADKTRGRAEPSAAAKRAPLMEQPATERPSAQRERVTVPILDEAAKRRRIWVAVAPVVLVVASALGWYSYHTTPSTRPAAQPTATPADTAQPQAAAVPPTQPAVTASSAPRLVTPEPVADVDTRRPWRVVAYTYNRRDQAQHKVDTIAQRDRALRPEVFVPAGGGSFLVTVGGAMTRDEAVAFRMKAQQEDLPRDSYIQNYEGHDQRHARRSR